MSPDTGPQIPILGLMNELGLVHRAERAMTRAPLSDLHFETIVVHLLLGLSFHLSAMSH